MISIVIPCYNHNKEVMRAVKSALVQQNDPEIIVVDDGSTTPLENIWGDRVQLLRHDKNQGLSAALNTGISKSRGDRFVILASDDELHPAYCEVMPGRDADIVSCDMLANRRRVRSRPGNLELLKKHNCHSYAALVKKKWWKKTGGFKLTMNPSWEDWEFWLNCAKLGAQWAHVDLPLHIYNRTANGRDAAAQTKQTLLTAKMEGYHQDLYGEGRGVVTVVIPCYDHEDYVVDAVQSALKQEYPHIRVVVVDDASPGNVKKIITGVGLPAHIVTHKKNQGLSAARNTGIRYAIEHFNSQFLVMLDADDLINPSFVEETLGALQPRKEYIYTDVQFMGDAWHRFETADFSCSQLIKKHLHPCTFLMPTMMWLDILKDRGYGYDEKMLSGYEDWEFVQAAVEAGWQGRRLQRFLFHYRHHENGSMRTEAAEIDRGTHEISNYIKAKHPKERIMGCKTCGGGGRFTARSRTGDFIMTDATDPGQAVEVTYNGNNKSTQMKIGAGGQIYKYSGNPNGTFPPVFFAAARDVHLFQGPFTTKVVTPTAEAAPVPAAPPEAVVIGRPTRAPRDLRRELQQRQQPAPQPVPTVKAQEPPRPATPTSEAEPTMIDDFTVLDGIGPKGAMKLADAGFRTIKQLAERTPAQLSADLRVKPVVAEKISEAANDHVKLATE